TQSGHGKQVFVITEILVEETIRRQRKRRPELSLIRPAKLRTHHADHLIGLLVQLQLASNDVRIAAEALLPRGIRQNYGVVGIRLVIFHTEVASEIRLHLEDIEPATRHSRSLQTHRLTVTRRIVKATRLHDGRRIENVAAFKRVLKI